MRILDFSIYTVHNKKGNTDIEIAKSITNDISWRRI